MLIKTRKYALPKRQYFRLVFSHFLRRQGLWLAGAYALLNAFTLWIPSWWWFFSFTLALILYVGFRVLQFVSVLYLEQSKLLFERLSYEIDSKQVLLRLNARECMPIPWSKIKTAHIDGQGSVLYVSAVQVVYLPNKIFQSAHDQKVLQTILSRKGYVRNKIS